MLDRYHTGTKKFMAIAIAWMAFVSSNAVAEKSMANPGYYHFDVGAYRITALSDGTLALPVARILQTSPKRVHQALNKAYLDSPVETSVNAYLIDTGARQILVDTGGGDFFGDSAGRLSANLRAAGYAPSDIDDVCLTHMHTDHAGGLVNEGERTFANATLHVARREADYWLDDKNMRAATKGEKATFKHARAVVEPYVTDDALRRFDGATELFPGVHTEPTPGHTPGHTSYRIESKGERLVILGDLIHVAAVQFAHPGVTIEFDSDREQAAQSRRQVFDKAATEGTQVAGEHLSFPGVGRMRAADGGYSWYPMNYSPN